MRIWCILKLDQCHYTSYHSGGKLLRETYGSTVLDFFYDANGTPIAMKQNGAVYYYITNLQGDVVRLVNAAGNTAAWYKYDPYGNATTASGSHATINPLRYRGYYYDTETGLYYCQSRYYDPAIGRFINADNFVSTGQGIIGCNMFAYCNNSPVQNCDSSGQRLEAREDISAYGGAALGLAGVLLFDAIDRAAAKTAEVLSSALSEIKAFAKAAGYGKEQFDNRSPRIHHVIPKGAFSHYPPESIKQLIEMQGLLKSVDIDINDPENLVIISHGTHKSMHTVEYIANIHSIMMHATRRDEESIRYYLFLARIYAASLDKYPIYY